MGPCPLHTWAWSFRSQSLLRAVNQAFKLVQKVYCVSFLSARAHLKQMLHQGFFLLIELPHHWLLFCTLFTTIKIFQLNRTCLNNIPG